MLAGAGVDPDVPATRVLSSIGGGGVAHGEEAIGAHVFDRDGLVERRRAAARRSVRTNVAGHCQRSALRRLSTRAATFRTIDSSSFSIGWRSRTS